MVGRLHFNMKDVGDKNSEIRQQHPKYITHIGHQHRLNDGHQPFANEIFLVQKNSGIFIR